MIVNVRLFFTFVYLFMLFKSQKICISKMLNKLYYQNQFSSATSHAWHFATPWTAAHQASCPSQTSRVHAHSCPLTWWCHPPSHPLSSPSPPTFSLSQHKGLFKWVSSSYQVAKVLEFQLTINTSNKYSGLISFKMDWLDLFAVQGTLKSLLQNHSSKASILWHSAFLIVQLSHPYMTTGKTIVLTRWTLLAKQCLCFLICCLCWW